MIPFVQVQKQNLGDKSPLLHIIVEHQGKYSYWEMGSMSPVKGSK